MVTIKDFIKQVLADIREVKDEEVSFSGIRGVVDFDIATVAYETGGAGVKVGVWGIGGEVGGKLSNEVTSRVKFSVQTKGAISPGFSSSDDKYVGGVRHK